MQECKPRKPCTFSLLRTTIAPIPPLKHFGDPCAAAWWSPAPHDADRSVCSLFYVPRHVCKGQQRPILRLLAQREPSTGHFHQRSVPIPRKHPTPKSASRLKVVSHRPHGHGHAHSPGLLPALRPCLLRVLRSQSPTTAGICRPGNARQCVTLALAAGLRSLTSSRGLSQQAVGPLSAFFLPLVTSHLMGL